MCWKNDLHQLAMYKIVQLKRESYQPQLLQDFSQYKVGARMMDVWYIYRTLKNSKVAVNFTLNLKPLKPAIRFLPKKNATVPMISKEQNP